MVLVNALEGRCSGNFTPRGGATVTDRTTIDYCLVGQTSVERALHLAILEDCQFASDHRPIQLSLRWPSTVGTARRKEKIKRSFRLVEMDFRDWDGFQDGCDLSMAAYCADLDAVADDQGASPQGRVDYLAKELMSRLEAVAVERIGVKFVVPSSKPWLRGEVSSLYEVNAQVTTVLEPIPVPEIPLNQTEAALDLLLPPRRAHCRRPAEAVLDGPVVRGKLTVPEFIKRHRPLCRRERYVGYTNKDG